MLFFSVIYFLFFLFFFLAPPDKSTARLRPGSGGESLSSLNSPSSSCLSAGRSRRWASRSMRVFAVAFHSSLYVVRGRGNGDADACVVRLEDGVCICVIRGGKGIGASRRRGDWAGLLNQMVESTE